MNNNNKLKKPGVKNNNKFKKKKKKTVLNSAPLMSKRSLKIKLHHKDVLVPKSCRSSCNDVK